MGWIRGASKLGTKTNEAVNNLASSVDGQTRQAAARAVPVLVLAVQLLRWPALALLILGVFPWCGLLALAVFGAGPVRWISLGLAVGLGVVLGLFEDRRRKVIEAVRDPEQLTTEMAIATEMTGRVDESREILIQIAGPNKHGLFARLTAMWRGIKLPDDWITEVTDLPRARYFVPPKIGGTVTLAVVTLVSIPVAFLALFVLLVAAVAS